MWPLSSWQPSCDQEVIWFEDIPDRHWGWQRQWCLWGVELTNSGAALTQGFLSEGEYISLLHKPSVLGFSATFSLNHPNDYTVPWRNSIVWDRVENTAGTWALTPALRGLGYLLCTNWMPLPHKAFLERCPSSPASQQVIPPYSGLFYLCILIIYSFVFSPCCLWAPQEEGLCVGHFCIPPVISYA